VCRTRANYADRKLAEHRLVVAKMPIKQRQLREAVVQAAGKRAVKAT
jgi:hypothetical protein